MRKFGAASAKSHVYKKKKKKKTIFTTFFFFFFFFGFFFFGAKFPQINGIYERAESRQNYPLSHGRSQKKKKKKKGMLVFHLQWPSFTSGDRGVNFLYF